MTAFAVGNGGHIFACLRMMGAWGVGGLSFCLLVEV